MYTAFLVIPFVLLMIVALVGFVGCTNDFDELGAGGGEAPDSTTYTPPDKPYSGEVVADLPIAYWRLVDADLGEHARDEIGPSPDGTHFGVFNATADLDPTKESINDSDPNVKSIYFNGGYVTIEVAGKPELVMSAFTIEALVVAEWNHDAGDPFVGRVVACSFDESAVTGWALYATDDDYWQGQVGHQGQVYLTPKRQIHLNGLTNHLALTYDGSGWLRLFVDTQPYSSTGVMYTPNTTQPICIGANASPQSAPNSFKGRIQEVALYTFPLTQEQIGNHYKSNTASAVQPNV
jgi:Concanavalin A-like lectin/glucanases superfamily